LAASSGNAALLPLFPVMFYQLFFCVIFVGRCTTVMSVASRRRFVRHVLRLLTSINRTLESGSKKRQSKDKLKENVQAAGITGTQEQVKSVASERGR